MTTITITFLLISNQKTHLLWHYLFFDNNKPINENSYLLITYLWHICSNDDKISTIPSYLGNRDNSDTNSYKHCVVKFGIQKKVLERNVDLFHAFTWIISFNQDWTVSKATQGYALLATCWQWQPSGCITLLLWQLSTQVLSWLSSNWRGTVNFFLLWNDKISMITHMLELKSSSQLSTKALIE